MAAFFSDSDEDKAVEELLSQAMDSTVLEQVAAINCAGFNNCDLPSHLETRFQRLKSFPSAAAKPSSLSTKSFSASRQGDLGKTDSPIKGRNCDSSGGNSPIPKEKGAELKDCPSPCENLGVPALKKNPRIELGNNERNSETPDSWEGLSRRSVSPPVKSGCFLCSPKKLSSKKKKENRSLDLGLDWGKHDNELLSELSNFSLDSQKKMIRKAMQEEEKICREAEKIVKWAKQASARMDVSGIEDFLSDDENHHKFT